MRRRSERDRSGWDPIPDLPAMAAVGPTEHRLAAGFESR